MSTKETEKLSPAERITCAIAAALERGVRPWRARWDKSVTNVPAMPLRANGAPYRGVNVVALWAASLEAGYDQPYWLTFKQALELGGAVRKGERGQFVVFYKEIPAAEEAGQDDAKRTRRVARGYTVFDGVDARFGQAAEPPAPLPDELATRFARVPALVRHGGERAYYAPATDHVQMPPSAAFVEPTLYYATLAHELGHWTRHPTRLDRDFGQKRYGDAGYALEELVAELCSAFVGANLGLPADHVEDHASYIASWLAVVRDAPSAFLAAAGQAQLAADYLLHFMGDAPPCPILED